MGVRKTHETDHRQDYAKHGNGQIVSRSLFAVIERGDMPLDGGFGEAEIVEIEPPIEAGAGSERVEPMRIRIDTVPQDTIATSPDAAAKAAAAMQSLSNSDRGPLGFKVEYLA